MAAFALPLLAIALPLIFRVKVTVSLSVNLSLVFFPLYGAFVPQSKCPRPECQPGNAGFCTELYRYGIFSVLLFLFIGTILTMIVQASAATMAITLIMCANGWISLELGAALVLGENIGTTITANLAALTANSQAKRAALAHFVFNVLV